MAKQWTIEARGAPWPTYVVTLGDGHRATGVVDDSLETAARLLRRLVFFRVRPISKEDRKEIKRTGNVK